MTTPLYTVQQGDTLSAIAQRLSSSVNELRRLNPFINNPNYLRTGWTLNVPDATDVPVAPVADSPPPAADTNAQGVLHLDPIAAAPEQCSINFCGEQACKSPGHYADIIYEVGQERFWLLREHTLNTLVEAADDLKKKLLTSDPDSRVSALNDADLLEPFLEPKTSSFLDAQDSQRYLQIEHELEQIGHDLGRFGVREEGLQDVKHVPNLTVEQLKHVNQQQQAALPLRRERAVLDARGHKIALERGYSFEGGHLYSAEATRARDIIQRYLKQRQVFIDQGKAHFSPAELEKYQQEYTEIIAELQYANAHRTEPRRDVELWLLQSRGQFHYCELVKTLLEAAAYGLALPEYALQGDHGNIEQGFEAYEKYHALLRQKAALNQHVEKSFDNWVDVAKQQPPSSLFTTEAVQWQALDAQEQALKKQAEAFVKHSSPQRHLLWNPESFTPQPQQRLVRTNFPLREISVPTERTRLRHLSLTDVFKHLNQRTRDLLKEDLKKTLAQAKDPNLKLAAGTASADPDLFTSWLRMNDARPLDIQDGWFDRNGFFQPETFKRYINTEKIYIENLRDDATFDAWGKDLRQMLFKHSTLGPLRLYDNSPQARLIRCLTQGQSDVQLASQVLAPSVSMKKGLGASANVTLDVNLAQGEIEVASFELPSRAEAKPLTLSYTNENDDQGQKVANGTVSIGAFCLSGSLKAWGFAGASMMLSANLRVGPNKQENDELGLDTGRDAERRLSRAESGLRPHIRHDEVLGGQFNLFAGAQAGIKINGSLLWTPPDDLLTLRHPVFKKHVDNDGWLELATLGIDASAALGVGTNAGLTLSLQNGYVILRMNATIIAGPGVQGAFNFIVGYKAIIQILDIFNKALVENNYKKMAWVQPEAFAYFSKLQLLSALGVDIQWVFLRGYNIVNRMYDAIKAGGRAGPMARDVVLNVKNVDFKQWYSSLTPEGLGSLLDTLLQTPRAFEVAVQGDMGDTSTVRYTEQQCHLLQQQAIEIILTSIYENATANASSKIGYERLASAQERFGKAVLRFSSFNKPARPDVIYCENVYRMSNFMAANAGALPDDNRMQARYFSARKVLGEKMDAACDFASMTQFWKPEVGTELAPWPMY
ncbi:MULTISPECIES: LysM domain-containing protein [unclassified Pseudomonas]|uniref:LysM peptidoglycan-binding domain-containing protein n=1 Tax=unclassified Pseudomonas TaxID=196821 RepID=UPI002B22FF9C|nr:MULTISPECIES: LysM domain-containing protein [unclassified Pseudomonas]MEA9976202.1 LysM domain-containing protein [Pseudomonas sp. RTS4]MEB0197803.1 LysM domain-containing protein [Pseudomonas sp. 5S4]MEB0244362.1 LysM domain-containing protein [Pseudomonas sp. 10S5]